MPYRSPWTTAGAAAVAALVVWLYLPTLAQDFVFDGRAQVLTDTYIHQPRHILDVLTLRVLGSDVLDRNRPVMLLSLLVDARLWGKEAVGYHLTNVLLHAACAVLLYLLALRLWARRGAPGPVAPWVLPAAAALGALFFAAHPLTAEPVCAICFREDELATLFLLLALHAAASVSFARAWGGLVPGAACVACSLVAVGAKETGAVAPVLIGLYAWWFRRGERLRPWLVLTALSLVAVAGFMLAVYALTPAASEVFVHSPERLGGSVFATVLIQVRILAFYVQQLFLPWDLCAWYTPYSLRQVGMLSAGLTVVAAAGLLAWAAWRNASARLGVAIIAAGLAPVSNLVPIYIPVADRYLYLPLAGAGLVLAGVLATAPWGQGRVWLHRGIMAAVAVIVIGFMILCVQRQTVWTDEYALWSDTLARNPTAMAAANNLAFALLRMERADASVRLWKRALELSGGTSADAWGGCAIGLARLGRGADAANAARRAAELDARYAQPSLLVQSLIWEEDQAAQLERVLRQPPAR